MPTRGYGSHILGMFGQGTYPQQRASVGTPNLNNLQQLISSLMGNRPASPLANAMNGALANRPVPQNTWDWQGGEPSPYGIRSPSLGWQWHYDQFGKPVPNVPIQREASQPSGYPPVGQIPSDWAQKPSQMYPGASEYWSPEGTQALMPRAISQRRRI